MDYDFTDYQTLDIYVNLFVSFITFIHLVCLFEHISFVQHQATAALLKSDFNLTLYITFQFSLVHSQF